MLSHAMNRYICSQREGWIALGNMESKLLAGKIVSQPIVKPVYITGLARGGTTIMLELLSQLQGVVTHTYRDFPLLLTPYALRKFYRFFDAMSPAQWKKVERAHHDRILVTPKSPESMEEVLWMSFFKHLHEESQSNVLTEITSLPAFEQFYQAHIKKLLLAEKGTRYVSKANYNVTRIRYLSKLLPDACFLLLIRDPVHHIASLMKQDKLFREIQTSNPKTLEHMQQTGHFEFGLGRKLINTGNAEDMRAIQEAFAAGKDVTAWALYWNSIYRYASSLLEYAPLDGRVQVVHYEELCADTAPMLNHILDFCSLFADEALLRRLSDGISEPTYYAPSFTPEEIGEIARITGDTYRQFDAHRMLKKA